MRIKFSMQLSVHRDRGADKPDGMEPPVLYDVSGSSTELKGQWDHDDRPPVRLGFQAEGGHA